MRTLNAHSVAALLTVGLGLAAGQAGTASGATFRVDPVKLELGQGRATALVTVHNVGDDTLRLQVTGFRWEETPGGVMHLEPTEEIVFFPALLTVEAGKTKNVRVGTSLRPGAMEASFRLFFQELPPAEQQPGMGVRILTRFGVPVFVLPLHPEHGLRVDPLPPAGGAQRFRVVNTGTVHAMVREIRVSGRGASGKDLFHKRLQGWYILAGGVRDYDLPLSSPERAGLVRLEVEVETEAGTVSGEFSVASAAAPASPGTEGP